MPHRQPMTVTEEQRARGAVLGLAWGDVLGCPVEGWREADITRHYGRYETLPAAYPDSVNQLPPRRRRRLRPLGLHSDDTQQALALLGAALDPAGWSVENWVRWLVAGSQAGAWRGTGGNFNSAVAALRRGVPPHRSGSASAGIGAAMRAGPTGAALRSQPQRLADVVMQASLSTHRDLRAAATAYAVAEAVRPLTLGEPAATVRTELPRRVRDVENQWCDRSVWKLEAGHAHTVSDVLAALCGDPPADLDTLGERVSALARGHLPADARAHPNQGFALLAGMHGLMGGLLADSDPHARLAAIVAKGDDTDTVGAICGTVLGARHGDGWIPIDRLVDGARLRRWADAVAAQGLPPEDRAVFCEHEAALTSWEADFQRRASESP